MTPMQLGQGHPHVLGAHVELGGVNFSVFAPHADAVDLCLFDDGGTMEVQRIRLLHQSLLGVWHGFLNGARPGLLYGWRVHGPWQPESGHRFNPNKLLLDPCAKEVWGHYDGREDHHGHCHVRPDEISLVDNGSSALKGRVLSDLPRASVCSPQISDADRIIYELHVKGFSKLNEKIPEALRGTYSGLAHPVSIDHFKRLGITTLCLMPVAHRVDEKRLLDAGLTNYWGYNPIAWNAPEARYASPVDFENASEYGATRLEFRAMVETLHAAGLEVILDVVYNHSGETDEWGPTLSLRGLDNAAYYHLDPNDKRQYANWTGCGNCLNLSQPMVLRMVMDSLRHWVIEFGVDGFRFDLAPVMARRSAAEGGTFEGYAPFFTAIGQDPVLRQCTMIAEPWDIGEGGYRLGQFPADWLEWNDQFRDSNRRFWLSESGTRGEFSQRFSGSTDYFNAQHRAPHASVNFITAHDGFTLSDLVSFKDRRNWENGEGNRDGHSHNLSVNFGVEGRTDDAGINALRSRHKRVLLASLFFALGTPMLFAGDEFGHSQSGNNNAYCQDNPTTWLSWQGLDTTLLSFVSHVIALRHSLPALRSQTWWEPKSNEDALLTAEWRSASGTLMSIDDWSWQGEKSFSVSLRCTQHLILLFNGNQVAQQFSLPPGKWLRKVETFQPCFDTVICENKVSVHPTSLALFEFSQSPLPAEPRDTSA